MLTIDDVIAFNRLQKMCLDALSELGNIDAVVMDEDMVSKPHRQTGRQTDRHIQTHIHTHRHIHTYTDTPVD